MHMDMNQKTIGVTNGKQQISEKMMSLASPSKAMDHCQLICPSQETPWSVDVVSAIPSDLVAKMGAFDASRTTSNDSSSYFVDGKSRSRWHCVVTADTATGKCTFYVWYASPNDSLGEQKFKQPVLKLTHPKMSVEITVPATAPLIALEVSPLQQDVVYLYAVHPVQGCLVLWKISRKDLKRLGAATSGIHPPRLNCAIASVPLDETRQPQQERITFISASCLAAVRHQMIVLGTSAGKVHWVTRTKSPTALHVQCATPNNSQSAGGILTRVLWGNGGDSHHPSALVAALAVNGKHFYSICREGCIVHWKVIATESSHKSIFECCSRMKLMEALCGEDGPLASSSTPLQPRVKRIDVLRAAITTEPQADGSDAAATLHVLISAQHAGADEPSRLYWVRLAVCTRTGTLVLEKQVAWINRFVTAESVRVVGLVVADNGMAFAAFLQQESHLPPIIMALDWNGVLHELELPVPDVPSLLSNTLSKDVVTHGCTVLASTGVGLRIQRNLEDLPTSPQKQQQQQDQQERRRQGYIYNPSAIHTITTHLRSVFWDSYEHPDRSSQLPPSITTADPADLEEAIIAMAIQLQEKGNVSSTQNPLEWHGALLNLLQQTGLYRKLSVNTKWKLLEIGQEVAVFWALGSASKESAWEEDSLSELPSIKMEDWLLRVEESVLAPGAFEDRQQIVVKWLCLALETAMTYREERAKFPYDVQPNKPPSASTPDQVPLWTSRLALLNCIERQLKHWESSTSTPHSQYVESLVELGLQCFGDSYISCPADDSKLRYAAVQRLAITLLRKAKGVDDDRLAFELSGAHSYYAGLCQIALDHEKKPDKQDFSLIPFFREFAEGKDVQSDMPFNKFVLKWHTDRELFGHVLDYGKYCPEALNQMMEYEKALSPFRWIQAIRQDDYNSATDSLIANGESAGSTLFETKFSLSMAAIANRIVEEDFPAGREITGKRRRIIEKKRELVSAQESLFGTAKALQPPAKESTLLDVKYLLDAALQQLDDAEELEEKTEAASIGLAISAALDTDEACRKAAVKVWCRALMEDSEKWQEWLHNETDFTDATLREIVRDTTVFGRLVQLCKNEQDWEEYGPKIEVEVFENLSGGIASAGMRRLLGSATQQECMDMA